jgi:hypothetical protein
MAVRAGMMTILIMVVLISQVEALDTAAGLRVAGALSMLDTARDKVQTEWPLWWKYHCSPHSIRADSLALHLGSC